MRRAERHRENERKYDDEGGWDVSGGRYTCKCVLVVVVGNGGGDDGDDDDKKYDDDDDDDDDDGDDLPYQLVTTPTLMTIQ
ncbi:hypothetical protein PoB_006141400 [Plakobranchus ocellatus]|uniref:Uncharacterized protein n=1 Tax=Plakobranchus ocellatus TaxID=259542 RepID=A0AAV4CSP6_9GAST|nr:hypothetical protein PoB_006141400 [Plakobranchus ocellatus]